MFAVLFSADAQIYERGKKNFFIEPHVSFNFSNAKRSAYTGNERNFTYGLSGGKVFQGWIKVGLDYSYNNFSYTYTTSDTLGEFKANPSTHYAGIRADAMFPLMRSSLGKSKRYECRSLTNFIFIGPEYGMHFGSDEENVFTLNRNVFALNFSWGMIFKNSGSRKKQAALDFYIMFNLKKAFTPYMNIVPTNQKIYPTYWGVSFVFVKYRVGKWT